MRLPLVSKHPSLEIREQAQHNYRCSGRPQPHTPLPFGEEVVSPFCTNTIHKGDQYVAETERTLASPGKRPGKRDIGRYCVNCALRYFKAIRVANGSKAVAPEAA